ncbi:MAG: ABC transporter permease [Halieaceae bacterium]|jgi:putative ABC transport system permease protein|nr:ABC transporter permease [Halieaceae bacterium]
MNNGVIQIEALQLAVAFIPVIITLIVLFKWSLGVGNAIYAVARMLIQLVLIGYVLAYIFGADSAGLIVVVLSVMLFASSWIALGTLRAKRRQLIGQSLLSITLGGGSVLVLVTQGVLQLEPWYMPRYLVPLAGMIFANAMTAVSLAAERTESELGHGLSWEEARIIGSKAAMIPVINSLFAVGLVSLPGMMTGQILSGVSPLIAVRYQIMVMCMIFASAGLSTVIFLGLSRAVMTK